jgi:hypothetical protein
MHTTSTTYQFVICVRNDGYPAALEPRKLYLRLHDDLAEQHGQMRVIDESGEDYLYPCDYFIDVELPADAQQALIRAA